MSSTRVGRSIRRHIRHNADFIVEELPRDEEFMYCDLRDDPEPWFAEIFRKLRETGVITSVRVVSGNGSPTRVYTVPDHYHERAEEAVEGRNAPMPCGHAGFSNAGDHYECQYDGCDDAFSREEVSWT